MKTRFAIGCLLAFFVLSLSGCGGTGQAEGANLPNTLHIVRYSIVEGHFAPLDSVIDNTTLVQDLYNAAYALQKSAQQGLSSCPLDNGIEYHLNFLHGTTSVQQMDFAATGCQVLDLNATGFDFLGIDTHDRRFTTPSFRTMFAALISPSPINPLKQ